MPMLREIPGPAGRLEALLDEPPWTRGVNADGLVEAGQPGGIRAAVVLAHPHTEYGGTMHTKAVYQAAKALAASGARCSASTSAAPARAPGASTTAAARRTTSGRRSTSCSERYPGAPLWAAGMSFGAWVALTVGAEDARVSRSSASRCRSTSYDFERGAGRARRRSSSSTANVTSCAR